MRISQCGGRYSVRDIFECYIIAALRQSQFSLGLRSRRRRKARGGRRVTREVELVVVPLG